MSQATSTIFQSFNHRLKILHYAGVSYHPSGQDHVGTSSVRYEVGVFAAGQEQAAACGHFVHVYVDVATRRPVPLPVPLKIILEQLK